MPRTYTPTTSSDTVGTLFTRTMLVVAVMNALTASGAHLTWGWPVTNGMFWGSFVVSMCLLFAMHILARVQDAGPLALFPTAAFAFVEGAMLGPVFSYYVKSLGAELFEVACLGTAGTMAIAGIISTMVTFDYRKAENYLLATLFGFILVGIGSLYIGMSNAVNLGYSALGVLLFTAFFLVDFMRLRATQDAGVTGWGASAIMATNLYLDQINLLLQILQLMSAVKKK